MQAQAVDVETNIPVGKIPHFDDMVAFFKDPKTQPKDRGTLVHGDYKIDNLVFHKTEPRVIGILEYVSARYKHDHPIKSSRPVLTTTTAGRCPQSATPSPTSATCSPPT